MKWNNLQWHLWYFTFTNKYIFIHLYCCECISFSMNIPLFSWSLLCWFTLFPYQAISSLSKVSSSTVVELKRMNIFEMEEDIRKEQNKILHGNTNSLTRSCMGLCQEKFVDTKGVISDCKTKQVIQYNEKRTKGQTMICKTLHRKQEIE